MLSNTQSLQSIRESWNSVRIYEAMIDTHMNAPPSSPFGFVRSSEFNNLCYSLIVLFAFSVLEDVLKELRSEGKFSSSSTNLKILMRSSRAYLSWNDFGAADSARIRRNEIAHDQKLVSPTECKSFLDIIEDELVTWGVLQDKVKGKYTISLG